MDYIVYCKCELDVHVQQHTITGKEAAAKDGGQERSASDVQPYNLNLLAEHFSRKMTISDLTRLPLLPPVVAGDTLTSLTTTEEEVRAALTKLEEDKAVGPDELSPRVLRRCATKLAPPLTLIFGAIPRHNRWPRAWKVCHVVPVHIKGSKGVVENYLPVSLLSVAGKVLEGIIAAQLTKHLESQNLLSDRQFGFRKVCSAADLNHLLISE
ncbi:RNA-directed DNA polymerase from mobile element jockey [Portunus trituberculatus]|uniref:RNA-directed DNA polymerase from mobile element jockey n=1 Tax=Portunus trituberculatus TaxID=210409 RepID=A0A5B7GCB7_PORTR|nr:RNA-directed DNA polymerase from mobile element jockey [Portunus trituberculatus]